MPITNPLSLTLALSTGLLYAAFSWAQSPVVTSPPTLPTPPPPMGPTAQALEPMKEKPAKFLFTSNLDMAKDVFISLTADNGESVVDLAKALAVINKNQNHPTRLVVLFPESFGPLAMKQKPQVFDQVQKLKRDLKRAKLPVSLVEFQPHKYLQYSWLQDLGEFFWYQKAESKTWDLGFLDVNRGNRPLRQEEWPLDSKTIFKNELPLEEPLLLVHALKQFLNFEILRLPPIKRGLEFESLGNQGGNLEILPGGIPLLGDGAPSELVKFVEEVSGKKPVSVPVRFLQVPQVDQVFSIIPSSHSCGFSLLAASPLWGAQIQKSERFKKSKQDERMAETLFFFAKSSDVNLDKRLSTADFDMSREPRKYRPEDLGEDFPEMSRYFDVMVRRTLLAQADIEAGVAAIRSRLKTEKLCDNLDVIEVPVLASFPGMEDYFEPDATDESPPMVFQTATPNLLVINGNLIMANFDQSPARYASILRQQTLKQLEAAKISAKQVHFVRAGSYVDGTGSIHSGTLVLRVPDEVNGKLTPSPVAAPTPSETPTLPQEGIAKPAKEGAPASP